VTDLLNVEHDTNEIKAEKQQEFTDSEALRQKIISFIR